MSTRQRPLCEVRMGNLNVGDDGGKGIESSGNDEETEVLCEQETKWKGDMARKMAEGYRMLHAGGDSRSNGVGMIVNVEISKEVIRVWRDGRGGSLQYG